MTTTYQGYVKPAGKQRKRTRQMLQWPGTRVLFCWKHSTTSQGMQGSGREGESTANPGMSTDLAQPT